jgi:erythromycin esterase
LDPVTGRFDAASAATLPAWLDARSTRIVGMGEATHGTKEFNDLRAAIVMELAARAERPIVFLLEDEFVRGAVLAAYLDNGAGSAASGLRALRAGTWKNRELALLMERLRALRTAYPAVQIVFRGVDMQDFDAIWAAVGTIAALPAMDAVADVAALKSEADAYVDAYNLMYEAYTTGGMFDYGPVVQRRTTILAGLQNLRTRLEAAANARLPTAERARLLMVVRIAEQNTWKVDPLANAIALYGGDADIKAWLDRVAATVPSADIAPDPLETRDRALAENAEALVNLEGANALGILWAHNGHVARGAVFGRQVAGGHLRDRLGTGYRVLGTDFYAGSFVASSNGNPGTFSIGASSASYFANAAARICSHAGFLDLTAVEGTLASALTQPFDLHFVGAEYDPAYPPMRGVLGALYDGFVFVRDTSPSQPLN